MWCGHFLRLKKYNFFLWALLIAVITVKLLKIYIKICDGRKAKFFAIYSNVFYFCNLSANIYIYIYVCELHSNILILLIGGNERKGI